MPVVDDVTLRMQAERTSCLRLVRRIGLLGLRVGRISDREDLFDTVGTRFQLSERVKR